LGGAFALLIHFRAVSPEKLGQHFLIDANWRDEIANAIHIDGGLWVEIGAGHGEMTAHLARRAERVIAIEFDRTLASGLRKSTAALGNVEIIEADVLAVSFDKITEGARFSVYGNLPYYITSPILFSLFEHTQQIAAIHIMIQLEVAKRVVASPGSRDYGYLSVASQWFRSPELMVRVPPNAFTPPPKVESALVSLRPPGARTNFGIRDEPAFLNFVKECFAQKRKTLRNNLRTRLGERAVEVLGSAGLDRNARAEQLSIADLVNLFQLAS
jgi:16S rRNA (adenine1518-N6/adenine1519-N6)-dimethyltransferase